MEARSSTALEGSLLGSASGGAHRVRGHEAARWFSKPRARIWLIVSNTITSAGLGDTAPQLKLQNFSIHALVTKSFEGAAGGLDVLGL